MFFLIKSWFINKIWKNCENRGRFSFETISIYKFSSHQLGMLRLLCLWIFDHCHPLAVFSAISVISPNSIDFESLSLSLRSVKMNCFESVFVCLCACACVLCIHFSLLFSRQSKTSICYVSSKNFTWFFIKEKTTILVKDFGIFYTQRHIEYLFQWK